MNLEEGVSDAGASTLTNVNLNSWRIDSDRYPGGIGIHDLSILSPTLDSIIHTISSYNDTGLVSDEHFRHAKQICDALSRSYAVEAQRVASFVACAQNFFPVVAVKTRDEQRTDPYKCQNYYGLVTNKGPDGFIEHQFTAETSCPKPGIIGLLEGKNTEGKSGDPNVQIIFDYAKLAKKMINAGIGGFVPTILLTLAGSTLSVGIGLVTSSINASFIVEGFMCTEPKQTAMLMIAIGKAIELTRSMYADQKQCVLPVLPMVSLVKDAMVAPLEVTDKVMKKHVYRAKGARYLSSQRYFAVKFTPSYSFDLHRLLEEKGLAPELLTSFQLKSGLFCIIMEWISPVLSCEELVELDITYKRQIAHQLFQVLYILEHNDFVLGDIRSPNILVTRNGKDYKVVIIDLDFSGQAGVASYPVELNMSEFPWLNEFMLLSEGRKLSHAHDQAAVLHYLRNVLELSEAEDGDGEREEEDYDDENEDDGNEHDGEVSKIITVSVEENEEVVNLTNLVLGASL